MFFLALVAWFPRPANGDPDPLLEQQWHLQARSQEPAGANVRAAWPTTQGTGVVIGIVDDGLQRTHPDLQPNYVSAPSYDFNFNDPDPSPDPSFDYHGTAVSGVAAARSDNGIGVSGAAPLASLAGLRLIAGPTSDAQEAAALGYQGDVIDISSNSWGPNDNGQTLEGPGPLTESALATAVTSGRNDKGRIFVWAAGNGGSQDNCNFDGYANSRFVIAVGALADSGQRASYSEQCAALLVTAPSSGGSRGITTTDLVGNPGYSFSDYTSSFGGTSSAAPLVSGSVALMLAQNPTLTWRDVQYILATSAVKINLTDSGWTTGPFAHNEKYGFGLIDAQAAVNLAATWTNVAAESAIPAVTHTLNSAIPDNNATGVTDNIVLGSEFANFTVEHVEVEFTATHPYRGDLEVSLISPAGVASRLATVRVRDSGDNFSAWHFQSVRHWGESAAGTWTLRVADRAAADIGTWNSWTLRIFGTTSGTTTPDLTVISLSGPATGTVGEQLNVSATVYNQGSGSTGSSFAVGAYLSIDPTVTTGDILLSPRCTVGTLAAGASSSVCSGAVTVPSSVPPNTYYLGAIVDDQGAIAESDESNNARVADTGVILITQSPCSYSIAPTSQSFSSSGGTGSVSVTTSSGCSWTAVSNNSWITISSGSSGTGNGTVNYSVAAHTSPTQRNGTLTIAEQTFSVTQAGQATSASITVLFPNGGESWLVKSSQTIRWNSSGVGGNVKIELSRDGGASWTALFSSTANDGAENWKVTGPKTTQARIRVRSVNSPSVADTSNANFTIKK